MKLSRRMIMTASMNKEIILNKTLCVVTHVDNVGFTPIIALEQVKELYNSVYTLGNHQILEM